jgi:hypothetical protein
MKVLKLLCSDFPPEIVHLLFQVTFRYVNSCFPLRSVTFRYSHTYFPPEIVRLLIQVRAVVVVK